jgi:DNA-binding protein Alba
VEEVISDNKSAELSGRNIVYIGRQKPMMNYVVATLICLNNSPDVTLMAQGGAISFDVDVAQITTHRFALGLRVADIKLGTKQLPSQEGGTRNVSTIEIKLTYSSEGQRYAIKPSQ